jgi:glycosyltransferase involved in cell wall biosynthesis
MVKKKILHIHPHDEQLLNYLESNLTHNKHENTIIHHEEIKLSNRVINSTSYHSVLRVPIIYKHPFNWIISLRKIVLNKKFDIIHSHMGWFSLFVLISIIGFKGKKVVHIHNSKPRSKNVIFRVFLLLSKFFINKYFDLKLACSTSSGNDLFGHDYINLPNLIDYEKFKFQENSRIKFRKELGIKNHINVLCHIGDFNKEKNHFFLIDIMKNLVKLDNNKILVLVGGGTPNEKSILQKYITSNNLDSKVFFLGFRNDIPEVLSGSDIFIFPSKSEGFGMSLVEAQISGLPCLYSSEIPNDAIIQYKNIKSKDLSLGPSSWAEEIENFKICSIEKRKNLYLDASQSLNVNSQTKNKLNESYLLLK